MSDSEQPQVSSVPEKKRRKSRFGRILLILVVLFVVVVLAAGANFLLARQAAWDYIPKTFQVYLQVPSISTVYDKWANLDALQLAFAETPKLASLQKSLLSFKSSGLSNNLWFRALIDVQAHLVVKDSKESLVILDLGWRSIITRWIPYLGGLIRIDGLSLIQKDGRTIFKYDMSKESAVFVTFVDNLALVAFSQESIESLFSLHTDGESLTDTKKTPIREEFAAGDSGNLRLLAEPRSLVSSFINDTATRSRINNLINFKDAALVTMNLDNTSLTLNAATVVESPRADIAEILARKNSVLSALRYLPDTTYFYSAVSLGDFRSLMRVYTAFTGQSLDDTLRVAEEGAQTFLRMGLDEALWSWMGEEAGMFYLGENGDPVFNISIKDEGKRQGVFKKLGDSLVLDVDKSLVLDKVPVAKIVLPPFTKALMGLFKISLDTPYYIVQSNHLFLSMNPENLTRVAAGVREGTLLFKSKDFDAMMYNTPKNPSLFVYYNLDKSVPFFLRGNNLLAKALKLYNRGALSLFINNGRLSLTMNAARMATKRTISYPGFPITIDGGLKEQPWIGFLQGRSDPVIALVRNKSELHLESIAASEIIMSYPVEPGTRVLPVQWDGDLVAWSPAGTVYRFNVQGDSISPFPVLTPSQGSFTPVINDKRMYLYNRAEQSLFMLEGNGGMVPLPLEFDAPVVSAPDFRDGILALTAKTFEGTTYLADEYGKLFPGWPYEGGGISLSGAKIWDTPVGKRIAFLTQSGMLNVWKPDGTQETGFPLKLNGVFSAAPQFLRSTEKPIFAVIDQESKLSLIGLDGSTVLSTKLRGDGSEASLSAFDIDRDGNDELFVSGGKNSIDGLDQKLTKLRGFPVTGSFRPQFIDLNLDGQPELVAASYDGHIYAYTLSK